MGENYDPRFDSRFDPPAIEAGAISDEVLSSQGFMRRPDGQIVKILGVDTPSEQHSNPLIGQANPGAHTTEVDIRFRITDPDPQVRQALASKAMDSLGTPSPTSVPYFAPRAAFQGKRVDTEDLPHMEATGYPQDMDDSYSDLFDEPLEHVLNGGGTRGDLVVSHAIAGSTAGRYDNRRDVEPTNQRIATEQGTVVTSENKAPKRRMSRKAVAALFAGFMLLPPTSAAIGINHGYTAETGTSPSLGDGAKIGLNVFRHWGEIFNLKVK